MRSLVPRAQLVEVLQRFDLRGQVNLFSRCMECNVPLEHVEKESVIAEIPGLVAERYTVFSRCPSCNKVYWRGSHWERMKKLADQVLSEHAASQMVKETLGAPIP